MSKELNVLKATDNEVVLGILNNSEKILNQVYSTYFPIVLRLVLNNNGDENDAKDIYQEAIIILYKKVQSGSFKLNSKLQTYIYAICKRLWFKKLNQVNKTINSISKDLQDCLPIHDEKEKHALDDLRFKQMDRALKSLGEPCKTLIEDFYIKNLSMETICAKFGYASSDSAKTQKYKCLQRLRKLFFQLHHQENSEW